MIEHSAYKKLQIKLRQLFRLVWVDVLVGILIVVSVGVTLAELVMISYDNLPMANWLENVSNWITYLFVIELTLRFIAATSKKQFLAEYWLDILATIPVFRPFRSLRAFRLLRLFRVLRLIGVINRIASHFPYVFRRGIVEYLVILGLIFITVLFGTIAMVYVERRAKFVSEKAPIVNTTDNQPEETASGDDEDHYFNFQGSFWFSIFSLFAGEPSPEIPRSWEGKTVAVIIMFMGVTIFAMFTGTVSAFMVERFRMQHPIMEIEDIENHTIICGWNHKSEIIIREILAAQNKKAQIVVITELDVDPSTVPDDIRKCTVFVNDDFTRPLALERAKVETCRSCVILSDCTGGRTEQDADARTILAALTVEKVNPSAYTCAELLNQSYGSHLEMGNVNDYIVNGEHSAYIIAQATLNQGMMTVLDELLSFQRGQELQTSQVPNSWAGQNYDDKLVEIKRKTGATIVAVKPEGGEIVLNPSNYVFQEGDEVVAIYRGPLKLT